jgi:hypothetical protein
MAWATCRCGHALEIPPGNAEHVICSACQSKVRIVRRGRPGRGVAAPKSDDDGFLRFPCPCGRRLKVSYLERPTHGKCPDCGTVVPVPEGSYGGFDPESPTEELGREEVALLDAWAKRHSEKGNGPPSTAELLSEPPVRRGNEAGMRVCPRCGKPIHLGAETCRACGIPVPKR